MQEHNDAEYDALLKSSNSKANLKKNAYFFTNQKYSAVKQLQQEQPDEEPSQGDSVQDQNQIAAAIKTFQAERKRQSKLLVEDVRMIEEED